eukprot:334423-Rhodomonas_salina.1
METCSVPTEMRMLHVAKTPGVPRLASVAESSARNRDHGGKKSSWSPMQRSKRRSRHKNHEKGGGADGLDAFGYAQCAKSNGHSKPETKKVEKHHLGLA